MTKRAILAATLLGVAVAARAELVEVTYTEYVRGMLARFQDVATARKLSKSEAKTAETFAATWVHLGPCKGSPSGNIDSDLQQNAISAMLNAHPAVPISAAFLENVALLMSENFGREPPEFVCRFALETAVPLKRVTPKKP
jgi:hypothetical protein